MRSPSLLHSLQAVVIIIAAGSFLISYNNLHQSALLAGIPGMLAWVFPITIDFFLLGATLTILFAGQKGNTGKGLVKEGWAALIIYTLASIAFNVHMAPNDLWSQSGFAMCPVGLCVGLHFLMRSIEIARTEPQLPGPVTEVPVPEELTEEQKAVLEHRLSGFTSYRNAVGVLGLSYRKIKDAENILKNKGLL